VHDVAGVNVSDFTGLQGFQVQFATVER
jgi:hypothetical protein